jgi:2',3'-cyclic-nucleotide 2'-phosphodiesterase (5'-nucleotidase family)
VGRKGHKLLVRQHCLSDRLTGLMNRLGSILIGMLLVGTILLPRASFADDVSRPKSVNIKIIAINDFHGNLSKH